MKDSLTELLRILRKQDSQYILSMTYSLQSLLIKKANSFLNTAKIQEFQENVISVIQEE